MKYIRTKDGIVNVSNMQECETDDDNGNRIFDGYEDENGTYYPVESIIAQSDTIEELIQTGDLVQAVSSQFFRPVIIDVKVFNSKRYGPEFSFPGWSFGIRNITAWWIKQPNGDYKKAAEKDDKGEWKLL